VTGVLWALLAACFVVALVWAWRGRDVGYAPERLCPRCEQALVEVPEGGESGRGYELFACAICDFAELTVHGVRSPLGYCPSCRQRSMELVVSRQGAMLSVSESCGLCGYRDDVEHDLEPSPPLHRSEGKVIPFRRPGGPR
jgi:hypothetical protein